MTKSKPFFTYPLPLGLGLLTVVGGIIAAFWVRPNSPSVDVSDEFATSHEIVKTAAEQPTLVPTPNTAELLFVGDMMFDRHIRLKADKSGGYDFLFAELKDTFFEYDMVVGNLEGPITANTSKSLGSAVGSTNNFIFTFDPAVAETLVNHNMGIVNLGNNHILNFGTDGLNQTYQNLDAAGIQYFGDVGSDFKTLQTTINDIDITFINYNQFVNSDTAQVINAIQEAEKQPGYVIVYTHWGNEYQVKSVEPQQKLGRQFIDAGADIVIGSHPHVVQEIEEYQGKYIVYSLGNFIFDQYFSANVQRGLMVGVTLTQDYASPELEQLPVKIQNNGQTVLLEPVSTPAAKL